MLVINGCNFKEALRNSQDQSEVDAILEYFKGCKIGGKSPRALYIYDNEGETADRYTAVYKGAPGTREPNVWDARGMNASPYHPQGIGMFCSAMLGNHLGRKIGFLDLPEDCRLLVASDIKDYSHE